MHQFPPNRLYGAPQAFASGNGFLLGARPRVLKLRSMAPLTLTPEFSAIAQPPELAKLKGASNPAPQPVRYFNPSIAPAPRGLCPRCAYAVTLRADTLHQCDSASPYEAGDETLGSSNWFQGTVVAILDAQLQVLGWTWLINSPTYQLASSTVPEAEARLASCKWAGDAGAFSPSWAKRTFDARLLAVDGELIVTYACSTYDFSLLPFDFTSLHFTSLGLA